MVATAPVKCYGHASEGDRVDLRWAGHIRRKTTDDAGGLVTSVNVGTGATRTSALAESAEARRVRGGGPSALVADVAGVEVRPIVEGPDARTSRFGRFRIG